MDVAYGCTSLKIVKSYSGLFLGPEGSRHAVPRDIGDVFRGEDEDRQSCFLYLGSGKPWPMTEAEQLELLPEEWLEEHNGALRARHTYRSKVPNAITMAPDGAESDAGHAMTIVPVPFRFCLCCGVSYGASRIDRVWKRGFASATKSSKKSSSDCSLT